MKSKTSRGYLLNTVVVVVLFIGFQILTSLKGSEGSFKLVIVPSIWQCCYLMVLAASLNLVLGFMGQLSLGHCGFMAIGAYTAALLSLACERAGLFENKSDLSFLLVLIASVLAAGILAALLSFLIGIPALRLKGDYLAIITLGFGMIIINIINNLPFCGQDGLAQGSAAASLYKNGLGFGSKAKVQFLWFALVVTILSLTLMTAYTWAGWISLLRFASVAVTTIGYWTHNAWKIRLSQLIGSPCTLVYDLLIRTWGGALSEGIAIVSILVLIRRFGWKNLANETT